MELAGVAPEPEGAEGIQPPVAEEAEPVADLACGDAEEVGDLLSGAAVGDPQDGTEAVGHPLVQGGAAANDDRLADGGFQHQGHTNPHDVTPMSDIRSR